MVVLVRMSEFCMKSDYFQLINFALMSKFKIPIICLWGHSMSNQPVMEHVMEFFQNFRTFSYIFESPKCPRTGPDDLQVMKYEVMKFYDYGKSC